jgi:L-gulonolactone oxidase
MVLADGSVVTCSPEQEPELFAAARVGLGALGVISTVTLRCVPAFTLRAVEAPAPYSEVLADLDQLVESNDHVDVHWLPHTDRALVKRNNRTPETPRPPSRLTAWWNDEFSQNTAFHAACRAGRRWPSLVPQLNWIIAGAIGSREYTDRSDRVFTSPRRVRFYEMEYAVPRGDLRGVLGELAAFIDSSGLAVSFPVEVRVAAADDIWLSTAYGRESGYIAVHVFEGTPYEEYFRGVAAIMDDVGGRPHWGKLHFQTAATLRDRYPRFADFVALRDRLDPDRRFANPYLDRVLGP